MSKLFKVFVEETRYAEFFVYGETEAEAQEDAECLGAELQDHEWDTSDWDVNVQEVNIDPPKHGILWSGGPDGEDLNAS